MDAIRQDLLNKALQRLEPALARILSKQGCPFSSDQVRAVQQYLISEGHLSSVDMNALQQQLLLLERRILPPSQQGPSAHKARTSMNFEREMRNVRQNLGDQAWSTLEPQLDRVLTTQGHPLTPEQVQAVTEWVAHAGYSRHLPADSLQQKIHALESRHLRSTPNSHSISSQNIADYLLAMPSQDARHQLSWNGCDTGSDFEEWVSQVFARSGFAVEKTPATRDHGADLLLSGMGVRVAVQVKFWTSAVGNHAVQEVVAAKALYKADAAWVVTNSTFTLQAIVLAKANRVRLIEGNELNSMAKKT